MIDFNSGKKVKDFINKNNRMLCKLLLKFHNNLIIFNINCNLRNVS